MRVIRVRRVVVALALAFASVCLGAPSSAATTDSPVDVTRAFYRWYFAVGASHGGWMARLAGAKPFLESRFYAELARIGPIEERTHREVIDEDPFIAAQIGALGVTARPGTIRGTRATVPVAVRLDRAPENELTIVLENVLGRWRIADIVSRDGSSRKALETNLAAAQRER